MTVMTRKYRQQYSMTSITQRALQTTFNVSHYILLLTQITTINFLVSHFGTPTTTPILAHFTLVPFAVHFKILDLAEETGFLSTVAGTMAGDFGTVTVPADCCCCCEDNSGGTCCSCRWCQSMC